MYGGPRGTRPLARDRQSSPSTRHQQVSEHLANERTHLAYVRTALALITLGITVNRFSIFLIEHERLNMANRPFGILNGTKYAGFGMVVYGFLVMALALRRYHAVDRAIERLDYRPDRLTVEVLTVIALVGGAAGILWMFE
jgi:putative membrane protein